MNEKLAPQSREVAGALENLGAVAQTRGDLKLAHSYYQRAAALWKQLMPGSLQWAGTVINLGLVVQDEGDLDQAEQYYREALKERYEAMSPLLRSVAQYC